MEKSSLLDYLFTNFKPSTFLRVITVPFHNHSLAFIFWSNMFFFFSTTYCVISNSGGAEDHYPKYHDLLLCTLYFCEIIFFINEHRLRTVITFLKEPLEEQQTLKLTHVQSEMIKDHKKNETIHGLMWTLYLVPFLIFYSLSPMLLLSHVKESDKCIDLGPGWVSRSLSNWYFFHPLYLVAIILSYVAMAALLLWQFLIAHSCLKIKYRIRLLCANLDAMNSYMDLDENSLSGLSGYNLYWKEISADPTVQGANCTRVSQTRGYVGNAADDSIKTKLKALNREDTREEQFRLFVAHFVEQHVSVIQDVNLVDKIFRHQLMTSMQIGMVVVIISLPKLKLEADLMSFEFIYRHVEIITYSMVLGVLCYIGQTVVDESEKLRQSIYNCDWTDKPHKLRKNLVIIQTVATKRLRLTHGGVYTLGLQTYGNLMRVMYSCISCLQSIL